MAEPASPASNFAAASSLPYQLQKGECLRSHLDLNELLKTHLYGLARKGFLATPRPK